MGCAVLFAVSSFAFAAAGQRVGALRVNQIRIVLAVLFLMLLHALLHGQFWPNAISQQQLFYLGISGFVGLSLGDLFFFHALTHLGPRLGTLLMSTAPIFAVLLEGPVYEVWPDAWQCLGIGLTLFGVAMVVTERRAGEFGRTVQQHGWPWCWALLCGVLGAAGQGLGMVLARLGMDAAPMTTEAKVPELSAALFRMVFGMLGVLVLAQLYRWLLRRPARSKGSILQDRRTLQFIVLGALLGPTLGIWLSLVALENSSAGIATTLLALTPVMVIPMAMLFGARPGLRGWSGTLLAVLGVVLLIGD